MNKGRVSLILGFKSPRLYAKQKATLKGDFLFWRSRWDKYCVAILAACPPKLCEFRYRTAQHFAKNQSTGLIFFTQNALLGFKSPRLYAKQKATLKGDFLFWRSRWDLNPRAATNGNTISNRARYDHFDTTPYILATLLLYQLKFNKSITKFEFLEN